MASALRVRNTDIGVFFQEVERVSRVRVSRAWWPLDMQRCIATNKAAQRRRSIKIRASARDAKRSTSLRPIYLRFSLSRHKARLLSFSVPGGSVLLLAGVTLAALVLQHWLLLFPLSLIWCIFVVRLPR